MAGFKLLGLRLSADDLSAANTGFNNALNEDNENIVKAFVRALQEEALVNQMKVPSKVAINILPNTNQANYAVETISNTPGTVTK